LWRGRESICHTRTTTAGAVTRKHSRCTTLLPNWYQSPHTAYNSTYSSGASEDADTMMRGHAFQRTSAGRVLKWLPHQSNHHGSQPLIDFPKHPLSTAKPRTALRCHDPLAIPRWKSDSLWQSLFVGHRSPPRRSLADAVSSSALYATFISDPFRYQGMHPRQSRRGCQVGRHEWSS
jgi:hypothetical protein